MATEQNWLGITVNFEKVEDRTSDSSFELLPEGFYKAKIKNVVKSVLGDNNKPALTVTLELEEGKKEIVHNLYLPENGDEQTAIDFKLQNLRNFFTRCIYSSLTKDEYNNIPSADKNEALDKMQKSTKGVKQFFETSVLVHIKQEPFIAQDKETKAIKFTEIKKSSVLKDIPKNILKLIAEKEKKSIDMSFMPVILFSNRIAACGFGFYNDFDESVELKNSKAFDFIQGINSKSSTLESTAEETKTVPNF